MKKPKHTLKEYQEISADAWSIFKQYFPDDADTSDFTLSISDYDSKYKANPRLYTFWMQMMRVFFSELCELKHDENPKLYEFYCHIDRIYQSELKKWKEEGKL